MVNIRLFKPEELSLLQNWWNNHPSCPKSLDDVPESTYILEYEGKPVLSCAILYTNWKRACWIEQLVADPNFTSNIRSELVNEMFSFLENEARQRGFTNVILFSYIDKLNRRYHEMGFHETLSGVTTFAKSL